MSRGKNSEGEMPLETIAFVGAVIAMFVVFGTILAWASHRTGSTASDATTKTIAPAE